MLAPLPRTSRLPNRPGPSSASGWTPSARGRGAKRPRGSPRGATVPSGAKVGVVTSVGSRGDSYDNALAESVNGLDTTEPVRRQGPWRGLEDLEFATLKWVDWCTHRRLFSALGYVPPAEYEANHDPVPVLTEAGTQSSEPPSNPGRFSSRSSCERSCSTTPTGSPPARSPPPWSRAGGSRTRRADRAPQHRPRCGGACLRCPARRRARPRRGPGSRTAARRADARRRVHRHALAPRSLGPRRRSRPALVEMEPLRCGARRGARVRSAGGRVRGTSLTRGSRGPTRWLAASLATRPTTGRPGTRRRLAAAWRAARRSCSRSRDGHTPRRSRQLCI
ncbi:MAG: transposase [Chloroflexi bacterium]|nr:transposase [Chloroflexota bacterium]